MFSSRSFGTIEIPAIVIFRIQSLRIYARYSRRRAAAVSSGRNTASSAMLSANEYTRPRLRAFTELWARMTNSRTPRRLDFHPGFTSVYAAVASVKCCIQLGHRIVAVNDVSHRENISCSRSVGLSGYNAEMECRVAQPSGPHPFVIILYYTGRSRKKSSTDRVGIQCPKNCRRDILLLAGNNFLFN